MALRRLICSLWLLATMARTRLPYCSPYRLFWAPLGTPQSASDRIHAAYARFAWRSMGPRHLALTAALCLLWPIVFVVNFGDTYQSYGWSKTFTNVSRAGLPGDAIRRLTGLFEMVRYGDRKSAPRDVTEAVSCLNAILRSCGEAL